MIISPINYVERPSVLQVSRSHTSLIRHLSWRFLVVGAAAAASSTFEIATGCKFFAICTVVRHSFNTTRIIILLFVGHYTAKISAVLWISCSGCWQHLLTLPISTATKRPGIASQRRITVILWNIYNLFYLSKELAKDLYWPLSRGNIFRTKILIIFVAPDPDFFCAMLGEIPLLILFINSSHSLGSIVRWHFLDRK